MQAASRCFNSSLVRCIVTKYWQFKNEVICPSHESEPSSSSQLRRKSCPVGLPSTVALFNLEIQWASNKRMVGGLLPLKVTQYKALSKSIRYSVGFYSLKNREGDQFSLLSSNSQIISCNWARRWGQKMWTRWNTLRLWGFIGIWRRRPFYLPHLARS